MALVLFVMLVNLRGVKESGAAFALPTYFFIVMMFLTVGIGLVRYVTGTLGTVIDPPPLVAAWSSSGCDAVPAFCMPFPAAPSALTGVEAISNGITAFREPRSRNAGVTLIWMSIILGSLLLGNLVSGRIQIGAVPSEQRDGHFTTGAHRVWQPQRALSRHDRIHHSDLDHGGQYVVR